MPDTNSISTVHVKKLSHNLEEIRVRTLDSIISKFNVGFGCVCDAVKKELIIQLFKWFTFDVVSCPEKVLDLLLFLTQDSGGSYLNTFGKLRFRNELHLLRSKVKPELLDKLNQIEECILRSNMQEDLTNLNRNEAVVQTSRTKNKDWEDDIKVIYDVRYNDLGAHEHSSRNIFTLPPAIDSTMPFDTSGDYESAVFSSHFEEGIKWLVMPWQPIVHSDKNLFSKVEDDLQHNSDSKVILHTCEYLTNVILQDFPAEVFLQRPTIVSIFHGLLQSVEARSSSRIVKAVLKTLNKITRSLRFRMYYYNDPSMANRKQMLLVKDSEYINYRSPEDRDIPACELPEVHYNVNEIAPRASDRNRNISENADESILQQQQMSIPTYCIETLTHVVTLLSIPTNPKMPLENTRYITDLAYELVQLLINSVTPKIWICRDRISLKIQEDLLAFLKFLGEIMQHFGSVDNIDYLRITQLHLLCIAVKLMSNLVPFELAESVLPKNLKLSICDAVLDASIFLMFPQLHSTLKDYAKQFQGADEKKQTILFEETYKMVKSMKAAVTIMKKFSAKSPEKTLQTIYVSKLCLSYHKNLNVVKTIVGFLKNVPEYNFDEEHAKIATKLTITLLAHGDVGVQETMYKECHAWVKIALGVEYSTFNYSLESVAFLLFKVEVLTEMICHGLTHENEKIRSMAEDILIYALKGQIQMGKEGWTTFLESLVPTLPLLQCFADSCTPLGKCITKMLDPDVSTKINIPYVEVLKGNMRLLYSADSSVRKEAICRLIWLLEKEQNSIQKLPRLSSLQNYPLGSICIIERDTAFKRAEGNYARSNLVTVLEMLKTPNIEPKIKKSALTQISVMMTDTTLHRVFVEENGLDLILEILSNALKEKDFLNYPDCAISILTILKLICSLDNLARSQLSCSIDVLINVLRSLFLFRDNECVKVDGSQLLCLFLYNDFMVRAGNENEGQFEYFNLSLPYVILQRMRLSINCKSHGKISSYRRNDISILHSKDPQTQKFLRQFWAWEWNDGIKMLSQQWTELNVQEISQKLMIQETDFVCMQYTSPYFYCQQQLYNIQNSTTHSGVSCCLDYLTMYLKLFNWLKNETFEDLHTLHWVRTFERFLIAQPTNEEDAEMLANMLTFLYFYVNSNQREKNVWLQQNVKSLRKSITELLPNLQTNNGNVRQWALKLARACSVVEESDAEEDSANHWIKLINFITTNFGSEGQEHFYNLTYHDCLLACLTYLITKCNWQNSKRLLVNLGNALIELISSFHSEGTVRFMGLSITRNSIICLHQVLYEMEKTFDKQRWCEFWYDSGKSLSWLPMLWKNRDPLVRASGLEVLSGLINGVHTSTQLLNAIAMAPGDLCLTLLGFITNRDECCLVKEEACIALSNLVKNCSSPIFRYVDSLKANVLIIHVEQSNVIQEISHLCSNCYSESTLDLCPSDTESSKSSSQSKMLGMPRIVSQLYNSSEEMHHPQNAEHDFGIRFIATPSLITAACTLLNNLIAVGRHEVVQQIYNCSLHEYILRCFCSVPNNINNAKDCERCCDILKMNTSLCTVLTGCIVHSPTFASSVAFSPNVLFVLFSFLNGDLYFTHTQSLLYLRNKFWIEIYNFLAMLSLTENQHFESIQTVLELCNPEVVLLSIYNAMRSSISKLQKSAIGFLAFLLSQEMQRDTQNFKLILDKKNVEILVSVEKIDLPEMISSVNKLSVKDSQASSQRSKGITYRVPSKSIETAKEGENSFVGAQMCKILFRLYIAHNFAKSKKNGKQSKEKDLITAALTNLLCVSAEAKNLAIEEHLPETSVQFLNEIFLKLSQQSLDVFNRLTENEKKTHPLFHDMNSIFVLLMNFMYENTQVKQILAKASLADALHKLWKWIRLNKRVLVSCLKLLATFTTSCEEATQTLLLTSTVAGLGLRKSPNTIALIHVLVHLVNEKIERTSKAFENEILQFSFHVLGNAVHNHECRVAIVKSNLLQFFAKINPLYTKRGNPWPLVEIYCLEFLMDFTYYEEGQTSVPKFPEALEALINLGKCPAPNTRILALSVLRNLSFNGNNRPRLLSSVDFIDLLRTTIKSYTVTEIGIVSCALWSLISNNQKGKLTIRGAGFPQCLQEALGKLTLTTSAETESEKDIVKMLQCVLQILSPSESNYDLR